MKRHTAFENTLLPVLVSAFGELLKEANVDDKRWRKLCEGISRHGLLTSIADVPRASRLPEIDKKRLEADTKYRRQIARRLARPLPPDFRQVVIPLERDRLEDEGYLLEMSELLGRRWMQKLLSQDRDVAACAVLLHSDADSLADSMERLYRYQTTARNVSHRMMLRFAGEEMDRSPEVQAKFNKFYEAADDIEQRTCAQFDEIGDRMVRQVEDGLALERINARCDAFIASL